MTNETQQVKISAGHTPGPWYVNKGESACFHPGNDLSIAYTWRDGDEVGESTIAEVWPGTTADADAYLIAAAPDLLEALEAMRRMIDRAHEDGILTLGNLPRDYTLIERSADAAIRKARGEGGASEP